MKGFTEPQLSKSQSPTIEVTYAVYMNNDSLTNMLKDFNAVILFLQFFQLHLQLS